MSFPHNKLCSLHLLTVRSDSKANTNSLFLLHKFVGRRSVLTTDFSNLNVSPPLLFIELGAFIFLPKVCTLQFLGMSELPASPLCALESLLNKTRLIDHDNLDT